MISNVFEPATDPAEGAGNTDARLMGFLASAGLSQDKIWTCPKKNGT
jgi:hypothetical protein